MSAPRSKPGARSKFLLKYQAPRGLGDTHELKRLNGANAYNIISDGFATLAGSGTNGPKWFARSNRLTIDGNEANPDRRLKGIAIHEFDFEFNDVIVRNANTDSIGTECM